MSETKKKKARKAATEEFTFDLEVQEVPVKIGDKNYILREANGQQGGDYQNTIARGSTVKGGEFQIGGVSEATTRLLGECLLELPSCSPSVAKFVRTLPSRISRKLTEKLLDMSGLVESDEEEEKEKNSETDTSGG